WFHLLHTHTCRQNIGLCNLNRCFSAAHSLFVLGVVELKKYLSFMNSVSFINIHFLNKSLYFGKYLYILLPLDRCRKSIMNGGLSGVNRGYFIRHYHLSGSTRHSLLFAFAAAKNY